MRVLTCINHGGIGLPQPDGTVKWVEQPRIEHCDAFYGEGLHTVDEKWIEMPDAEVALLLLAL